MNSDSWEAEGRLARMRARKDQRIKTCEVTPGRRGQSRQSSEPWT
jgi:hypothetical protein